MPQPFSPWGHWKERPKRRGLRCLLGCHDRAWVRFYTSYSRWSVFLFQCRRCKRLLAGGHAEPAKRPTHGMKH